jgi:hypothetical protein
MVGQISLEWHVSANMLGDEFVVDVDLALVRSSVDSYEDSSVFPAGGDSDGALVPHLAYVVTKGGFEEEVVVRRWNGAFSSTW